MAERLESFDFLPHGIHGNRRYAWEEWLDGTVWKAKRGEDYVITTVSFQQRLRSKAAALGIKVRANRDEEDGSVVFQFYKENEL